MTTEKIRIALHSFDFKILNEACESIINFILVNEEPKNISGPIYLPTQRRIYCVLRSPHVDKDSREQFEIRRYKRIIDIYPKSTQAFDTFLKIEVPPGVSLNIEAAAK
jgi:small subunit ribosomal protein S10